MSMLKKYEKAEKLMPWNTKKLALNIEPEVEFGDGVLNYAEEYFENDEKKKKYYSLNLNDLKISEVTKEKENAEKEEYHEEYTSVSYTKDKKFGLFVKNYNLYLLKGKKKYKLTRDGSKNNTYAEIIYQRVFYTKYLKNNKHISVLYSPDQKNALIINTKKENIGKLNVTQTFNKDSFEPMRPKTYEYDDWFIYENARFESRYLLLNLETLEFKSLNFVQENPVMVEYSSMWTDDSKGIYHFVERRDHKRKELYYTDLTTFKTTLKAFEETETFFFDESILGPISPKFSGTYYLLKDSILWWSNKDDNGAIYLIDNKTKTLAKRITDLNIYVSQILNVDEETNKLYFMASKFEDFDEPYYNALCVLDLNSGKFTRLTNENMFHRVIMSGDAKYYLDIMSKVDTPQTTILRKSDNSFEQIILKADTTKLYEAGYVNPIPFKVYNDTIKDYLYGVIVLPSDYNPSKKYPVIDYVYGGMQIVNTPKEFSAWGSIEGRECFGGLEGFSQLGFIGVVIDGPGTPFRGKKFHDISYQNMGQCSGLFSHPEVIEKLSETYKGMDLDKVGIWGNSAGGYATVRALSIRPDFYKVGVSSAGDHDNQIYSASWAERFNGPYDKEIYKKQDSARIIGNLEGKLLLVHGLLDDNVNPSQTFRLIEFLEKANKDYDLVVLPDTDHNVPANPYFLRRRFDYFVKNLLGVEPPKNYKFDHVYFNYDQIKD